ncbi:MAG: hypothetical protein L0G99_13515, partial [Propionibacteriales bacterium]|nr:hypothetical protein [Propionibacteriales bacterium]
MRVTVDGFVASPAFGGFIRYIESLTAALTAFGGVEVHHVAPAGQPFPDTSRFPDRVHVHEVPLSSPEG